MDNSQAGRGQVENPHEIQTVVETSDPQSDQQTDCCSNPVCCELVRGKRLKVKQIVVQVASDTSLGK